MNIREKDFTGFADLNFLKCKLILGNNEIFGLSTLCFQIARKSFLSLHYDDENKNVIINSELYDNKGNCVISIRNNFYQMSTDIWDIEAKGKNIVFRNKLRDVFMNIEFNGNDGFIKITGRLYFELNEFLDITDDGIFYKHIRIYSDCRVENAAIGLLIAQENEAPKSGGFFGGRHTDSTSEGGEVGFFHSIEMLNRYRDYGDRLPKDR